MFIYALSYVFSEDGEKSASIISDNRDGLMDIHNTSILNPSILYHRYKRNILRIDVHIIPCYTFNSITKTIKLYDISDNNIDWGFYAITNTTTDSLKEILIYMSNDEHKKWQEDSLTAKTLRLISSNKVKFDTYYAEGIMNA